MIIKAALAFLLLLSATACALVQKTPSTPPPKPSARQQPDAKAQQQYYDLGLQQYSNENYGEARESFQQVVDLGQSTTLGLKAQENLKKIQRILKTVEEIESK